MNQSTVRCSLIQPETSLSLPRGSILASTHRRTPARRAKEVSPSSPVCLLDSSVTSHITVRPDCPTSRCPYSSDSGSAGANGLGSLLASRCPDSPAVSTAAASMSLCLARLSHRSCGRLRMASSSHPSLQNLETGDFKLSLRFRSPTEGSSV